MDEIGRELSHRAEHKRLCCQFRSRQLEVARVVEHAVVVQQQVQVQRAAGKPRCVAATALRCLQRVQPVVERLRGQIGANTCRCVQKIRALETSR